MSPLLVAAALSVPLPITAPKPMETTVYDFKANDIDGKSVSLSRYRGQVLLIVNVASKCGLTPQYEALEKLYKEHRKEGLVILGFPANDFKGQEPGNDTEIKQFCQTSYGVTFPMFSKVVVTGAQKHPLYAWLIAQSEPPTEVEWNFGKFLIGRDGKVLRRFSPKTKPDNPEVLQALREALAKK